MEYTGTLIMASDFELQVLQELSEIKVTAATAAAVGEALASRLFDGNSGVIARIQGDIVEIKEDFAEEKKSRNIKDYIHYAQAPVVVGLHSVLRHFGIDV